MLIAAVELAINHELKIIYWDHFTGVISFAPFLLVSEFSSCATF
ncbi:hypothetical protein [Streptomyces sp. JJ66]|nr:hypothetical protein [Streptomyces sp. JJ66]